MLKAHHEALNGDTLRVRFEKESAPLTVGQVIEAWRDDGAFREFFAGALCECPFEAFFFENPPVTLNTRSRPFECVLVNGPALTRLRPDPSPFAQKFAAKAGWPVLTFPNLGGDATLIVPAPEAEAGTYTHLARFLRTGSRKQVDEFWRAVGHAMSARISDAPFWLSTAGLGVSWLHLRLDSRPKYYRHTPYATQS